MLKPRSTQPDYRQYLLSAFEQRRGKNPNYSLRAFARDLHIAASNLSDILKGKKGLSQKSAEMIVLRLSLTEKEALVFINSVTHQHSRSGLLRKKSQENLKRIRELQPTMTMDTFNVIASWYHFAIIEYFRLMDRSGDPREIAKALEISESNVAAAIDRLEKLELITKEKGRWKPTHEFNWSPDGIPSEVIRRAQESMIEKGKQAVYFQSTEQRDLTSIMMTLDPKDIPVAKKRIREFIRDFCDEFSEKATAEKVYALNFQLFDLTSGDKNG